MAYQSLSREDRAARFAAVALLHVGFAAIFVSLGGVDVITAQFEPPIKVIFEKDTVPPVVQKQKPPEQTFDSFDVFVKPVDVTIEISPKQKDDAVFKTTDEPIDRPPVGPDIKMDKPEPLSPEPVRTVANFDPRYQNQIQPPYPGLARAMGEEGRVTLIVQIDELGRVTTVALDSTSGSKTLDDAAMRYAKKYWRFKPATIDGKAVISSVKRSILFKLDIQRG
jgi:periplasmic protein TonB